MNQIFTVTGYIGGDEYGDSCELLFREADDTLPSKDSHDAPHESGYWDEDIWYYGMSAAELTRIIAANEELDGFYPTSFKPAEEA